MVGRSRALAGILTSMIRIGVLSAIVVAASSMTAQAEAEKCFDKGTLKYVDCPTEHNETFAGGYWGVHVGAVGTKFSGMFDENDKVGEFYLDGLGKTNASFGAHAGHMWSIGGGVLLGFEADASYIGATSRVGILDTGSGAAGYQYAEAAIDWTATARAKAGIAFDSVMPFVSAGIGLVDYNFVLDDEGAGTGGGGQAGHYEFSRAVVAPVVGGGVELALGGGFTVRAEGMTYLIDDTETLNGVIPDADGDDDQRVDFEGLTAWRAGFGYRL